MNIFKKSISSPCFDDFCCFFMVEPLDPEPSNEELCPVDLLLLLPPLCINDTYKLILK